MLDREYLLARNRTFHIAQSNMELLPNYYRATIRKARKYIRGVVADFGCGSGLAIPFYIDQASKIYAIDHNDELLERVRIAGFGDKVVPMKKDLLSIEDWASLPKVEFDTAILMDVLEHFEDDVGFLSDLRNKMKPGGYMVIKVPAHSRLFGAADIASGHFRRYDLDDVSRLGKGAVLSLVQAAEINRIGGLLYKRFRSNDSNFSSNFSTGKLRLANLMMRPIFWADAILPSYGLSYLFVFRT